MTTTEKEQRDPPKSSWVTISCPGLFMQFRLDHPKVKELIEFAGKCAESIETEIRTTQKEGQ